MSFEQWMALVSAITTPIVAIAVAYFGRQVARTNETVARTNEKVDEVHKLANGMKDDLVAHATKAAIAEGHAAGLAEGLAAGLAEGLAAGVDAAAKERAQAVEDRAEGRANPAPPGTPA